MKKLSQRERALKRVVDVIGKHTPLTMAEWHDIRTALGNKPAPKKICCDCGYDGLAPRHGRKSMYLQDQLVRREDHYICRACISTLEFMNFDPKCC